MFLNKTTMRYQGTIAWILIAVLVLANYCSATPFRRWKKYQQPTPQTSAPANPRAQVHVSNAVLMPTPSMAPLIDRPIRPMVLADNDTRTSQSLVPENQDGLNEVKKPLTLPATQKTREVTLASLEGRQQNNVASRRHVRPALAVDDPNNKVEINLEKADLLNLLNWYASLFKIDIISGDIANPAAPGKVQGNIISFHTHAPLTKQQAWDLLLNFLNLFGLTLVPASYENNYPKSFTVMQSKEANKAPLPSFIGTDWKELPDNDTKIRYVYFVENSTAANLNNVVKDFIGQNATLSVYAPLNALLFTDKASNIKSVMRIVAELDGISVPEAMSVLRLQHANAEEVATLYNALVSQEQDGKTNPTIARILGQKRQPTTVYFPPNTRVIPEKRTNALIVLGSREGIDKVEAFVLNHVDTTLKQPYSPLYVYELQYANATDMATILTNATQFATASAAAQFGGVRDGDKFLRPMTFVAEPTGNRLLIKAEKEDYLAVRAIIQELDVLQPQVNIEVLIVNVTAIREKELGTQLRNKDSQTINPHVNFQTSGIRAGTSSNATEGIITNSTGGLVGNLVRLAQGQNPGTTLISIGSELVGGVWALFKLLDTYVHSNVISHPFLSSTNKYTAQVSLGEIRRVKTGVVSSAGANVDTQGDVDAKLTVKITPQINKEGIINLDIDIEIDDFVSADPSSPTKTTKTIKTNATVANKEILAIGGLLKNSMQDTTSKVPLLGNIPIFGWFFKDKFQQNLKDNLLVFISAEIFLPQKEGGIGAYTQQRRAYTEATMAELTHPSEPRDPIYRWFFTDQACVADTIVDNFMDYGNNDCDRLCPIVDTCEKVIEFTPEAGVVTSHGVTSFTKNEQPTPSRKPSITQFVPEADGVLV